MAEPLSVWVPSDRGEPGSLLPLWTCSVREEATFVVLSLGDLGWFVATAQPDRVSLIH